jgi:CheY-like chemotaxis protein
MRDGRKLVLVVEDEGIIRMLVAEILSEAGLLVVEAVDGDMAVSLLDGLDGLDLLLTDIQMPGKACGNKVGVAAKKRHPGLPVVYSSGRPDSLLNRLDPEDRFLPKPFPPGEPLVSVRRLLHLDGRLPN